MFGILRYNYHESSDCFEYPKKSLLLSSYSNWKIPAKIFLPKKSRNRKFQTPKNPSIIPVTRNHAQYPPPWAQKATHVFQQTHSSWSVTFRYWSAVRSRRAGKKIGRMRRLSPPTTTPRCFFIFLFYFFICSYLSPHEKKNTLVSQPVNS